LPELVKAQELTKLNRLGSEGRYVTTTNKSVTRRCGMRLSRRLQYNMFIRRIAA